MSFGLDLLPDSRDPSRWVDEEGAARGSHVGLAVVLLLDPRAVGLGRLMILVGEEREGEAELLGELALAGGALGTDAPDVRATFRDRLVRVAELARLDGAAGRVVLGIEVEDRPTATLVGEVVDAARGIGQSDPWCRVADGRDAHPESVAGVSTTSRRPAVSCTTAGTAVRRFESPRERPRYSVSPLSG